MNTMIAGKACTRCLLAVCGLLVAACGTSDGTNETDSVTTGRAAVAAAGSTSPYLFVWAGAEAENESDFLAVIDADPSSERYAEIVASVPVGVMGMAHHSEHVMPRGDTLFVNSFRAGRTFLIDLSEPLHPGVAGGLGAVGDYTYPHSFERLPNGNVLATFQMKGESNDVPGGLVELDPAGRVVRAADAADPVDPELRPYSVTPIPAIDRAVSTTTDMRIEHEGSSFQVWRLSDLELLKTVRLPPGPNGEHLNPAEVRLLEDSTTAIMTTFGCAMYLLHGLETEEPRAELIHTLPFASYETDLCAVPATRGDIWLQPHSHSAGSSLISFDVSNPTEPEVLDRISVAETWDPHWISLEPEGHRVVLTSNPGETLYRVLVFRLDPESGALALDSTFRDAGSDVPGVSFERTAWPHGAAGAARPHGAVFSRP